MSFIDSREAIVSPIDLHLDWKGKESDGVFTYYDKELQENIKYKIGKCTIVNIWFTVKGFNENLNTSIYSNKIGNWDEEVIVKSKWDILAQWLWKDIRDIVSNYGGNIHKAITLFDITNNKLIEIYLKWQAGWGIVDKDTKKRVWWGFAQVEDEALIKMNAVDNKFPIIEFSEAKLIKGKAFNYNVPEFKTTEDFLAEENIGRYKEVCSEFDEYKKALNKNKAEKKTEEKKTEPVSESFETATSEDANDIFDDWADIPF